MTLNKPPYIFEDGQQTIDFIHVEDVANANLKALKNNGADYIAINIGTGKPTTILHLAQQTPKPTIHLSSHISQTNTAKATYATATQT